MADCAVPGWSVEAYGTDPWGSPGTAVPGGPITTYPPDFDLFCVGPCTPAHYLTTYDEVTTASVPGQFYALGYDLVVLSDSTTLDGGVTKTALINVGVEMPDEWSLEFTVMFDQLPIDNSDTSESHIYFGGVDNAGASAGLLFSKAGISYTGNVFYDASDVLNENTVVYKLEDSHKIITEGEYYTCRIVVSHTLGITYVYFTKTSELGANGHILRYVIASIPTSDGVEAVADGVYISARGTMTTPSQMTINSVCAGDGLLIVGRPPVADAGYEQEVQLCRFAQLDGSNSYDVDGVPVVFEWRLIDAPTSSSFVSEVHDGGTVPLATPTGFTNVITSGDLETYHNEDPIVAGDILLINGEPYTVASTAIGSLIATVEEGTLPDSLQNATIKLIRQANVFDDKTLEKPNFFPDAAGFWKFDLQVTGGSSTPSPRSITVVHTKESLAAPGVTPDVSFMWDYISDFWRLLEDPELIEVFWSGLSQIVGANMLNLWQIDYNKSLRDIQRTMQRRWLYYDLLVQEPFVALTTVNKMDNTGGFLVGSDGVRVGDRTYQITTDLSAEDVQPGDFLILNGLAYEITELLSPGADNKIITAVDFPTAITDYEIGRACTSTQIDFYHGLVAAEDDVFFEVLTKETGAMAYIQADVMAVCEEHPDRLVVDPTNILTYLDDTSTYSVYMAAVFRRKYLPINDRVTDIPRLQRIIKDPPDDEVLHRGVDYVLETVRGARCIRWEDVWVHEDSLMETGYAEDPTPPARMWAEITYIENLTTVESNFGLLADFSLDEHADLPNNLDYLSAVRGLWYVRFNSPSLYNVRVGAQILLGLPFSEEKGTILEIRNDIVSPTNTIFVQGEGDDGIVRAYNYPAGLDLEVNPDTDESYTMGDTVGQFAPLVRGVTVVDYKSDPYWFRKYTSQGIASEVQKFHRFGVEIEQDAYTMAGAMMTHKLVGDIKPTSGKHAIIGKIDAGLHTVDVQDEINFNIKIKLWEGICHNLAFGHASMWDEGDPSPMKMSYPPDGGVPVYDHERIAGKPSGWQSAYDETVSRAWTEDTVFQVVGPPNTTSCPVTVTSAPWSHNYATASIVWIVFRVEAPYSSGHPDTYDATPMYEIALRKNGGDAFVHQVDLTGLWTQTGSVYFVELGTAVSAAVEIAPTDELEVVIRAQGGSSNTPEWSLTYVRFSATQFSYDGDIVWGYDRREMCPEDTTSILIYADWPGGTPYYDHPLFAWDTDFYTATIVSGHIILDTTPIPWTYDDTLPAGQYGRRVTL